jgi:hypothetical protein
MLTDSNNRMNIFAREIKQTVSNITHKYQQPNVTFLDLLTGKETQQFESDSQLNCVFAFTIGGGSYHEYESFKTVIEQIDVEEKQRDKSVSNIKVFYGCDHIFTPKTFI